MLIKIGIGSWLGLIKAQNDGLVRDIGVSNFNVSHLTSLVNLGLTIPVLNQIEIHPLCIQKDVCSYCESLGIKVQAYGSLGGSPAGRSELVLRPDIHSSAELTIDMRCTHLSPAVALMHWAWCQNIPTLLKSKNKHHINEIWNGYINFVCEPLKKPVHNSQEIIIDKHFCWNPNTII